MTKYRFKIAIDDDDFDVILSAPSEQEARIMLETIIASSIILGAQSIKLISTDADRFDADLSQALNEGNGTYKP